MIVRHDEVGSAAGLRTDGRSPVHRTAIVTALDLATTSAGSMSTRRRTLRLAGQYAQERVEVAGDFTAWAPIEMPRGPDGYFSLVVEMARDARWRYQYRIDDSTWINDPEADDYENTPSGATSLLYT
jgi:hypothetical protein